MRTDVFTIEVGLAISGPVTIPGRPGLDQAAEDQYLSPAELGTHYGLPIEALRKRLERWKRRHAVGWHEVVDRRANEPRYLYRLGSVRRLAMAMKARLQLA